MTIKNLYPPLRPTLDLNFAKAKRLDPRVTFSRASIGTYYGANGLVQTAVAGQPRFDYSPTTGESLGLLIEESRANLITQSSDFSVWGTTPSTNNIVALNAAIAPDGTLSACEVGLTLYGGLTRNLSLTSGTIYTVSVWMKAKPGATYSAGSATVGAGNNTTTSYASQLNSTSAWFRATHTFTAGTTGVQEIFFGRSNNGGVNANFYAWGPQIEVGSFATSYIPTLASSVTRSADVASITGVNFTNFFNNQQGTLSFEYSLKPSNASIGNLMLVAFADSIGDFDEIIGLWGTGTNRFVETVGYNVANTGWVSTSFTTTSFSKYAIGYQVGTGTSNFAFNGNLQGARDTSTRTFNGLFLGGGPSQYISRISYWPTRLSDATLQALTQ